MTDMANLISFDWEEDDGPTEPYPRSRGARILVVDDDEDMRHVVHNSLCHEGYEIHQAESGRALLSALAALEAPTSPFDGVDLVLVDHRMPGITGLEALRTMRGSEWSTPAILMTAYPDTALEADARELGAHVLAKPFTREKLSAMVLATLLGKRDRPRAL